MDFANQTILHPIGFVATVILGLAMIIAPRRHAVLPIILAACFIAPAQRIVVLSLDFNILRILIIFGWIRLLLKNELHNLMWKPIDTVVVMWALIGMIAYTLLHASSSAFIFKLGVIFDILGMYFLFRFLIRNWVDIETVLAGLVVISVLVMIAFLIEYSTGRNIFSIFGGVPAITAVRDGKLRCQGAFAHPIMAGCFWASLIPLFIARWWHTSKGPYQATIAAVSSVLVILMCASTTPLISLAFAIFGVCMFPFRQYMKGIRWCAAAFIVGVHIIMNAPVWHLISRVNIFGSSTGWHRYHLIDQAVKHFGEWWLIGTVSTTHWDAYRRLTDITNQYILEGVRGGLITLVLFVIMISLAFQGVGRLWRAVKFDKEKTIVAWAFGVSLFVHCMNFIAVSYFGQIYMIFFLLLAMIASLTQSMVSGAAVFRAPRHLTLDPVQSSCFLTW